MCLHTHNNNERKKKKQTETTDFSRMQMRLVCRGNTSRAFAFELCLSCKMTVPHRSGKQRLLHRLLTIIIMFFFLYLFTLC